MYWGWPISQKTLLSFCIWRHWSCVFPKRVVSSVTKKVMSQTCEHHLCLLFIANCAQYTVPPLLCSTCCNTDSTRILMFLNNRQKHVCKWHQEFFFSLRTLGQALFHYKSLLHVTACYVFHLDALNLLVSVSPMWSIRYLVIKKEKKINGKQLSILFN